MYWDDESLTIEPYERKQKHYFCGRELLKFTVGKTKVYTILVVDLDECCLADVYNDAEIRVVFSDHSLVPKKHKCGGQSAARFARVRQECIKQWFKKLDDVLKTVKEEIYLGISPIYYKRFYKTLSTYNQAKIKKRFTAEYTSLTGIYQALNKINEMRDCRSGQTGQS